jgi:adenylate kinase family enzyme
MLQPDLPPSPRILVIGTSSAGKTTLASALSRALAVPRIELDELFWSAGWQPKPTEEFLALVRDAAAAPTWVADGNYSVVRSVLWPRANVVVWLNYSLPLVFWRGLVRATRRTWSREVLWHGNQESVRRTFFSRESILFWMLTTHGRRSRQFRQLQSDPQYAGIRWLEFRKPSHTSEWLERVRRAI